MEGDVISFPDQRKYARGMLNTRYSPGGDLYETWRDAGYPQDCDFVRELRELQEMAND